MASDASEATMTVTTKERRRKELTCQVCPVWRMSRARSADPGRSRRSSSSHGVALSACRLRMVVPSPSTARFSSMLSRCCCTAVSVAVGRRKYSITRKLTIRSRMNKSIVMKNICSDTHGVLEHGCRNRNARRFQLLGKFGTDSGRSKCSQHPAIRSHSLLFENENILHADYIVFHAGNLGHMGYAPRAIVEARDLDHQSRSEEHRLNSSHSSISYA